jgi:hypothetical protein
VFLKEAALSSASGRLLIGEGPRSGHYPTLAFWRKCGRAAKEKRRLNVGKKKKKKEKRKKLKQENSATFFFQLSKHYYGSPP